MTNPITLALLAVVFGAGQSQQNAPEMTTHDNAVTFKTAVNTVDVPVVMRDYKGRAEGTLTKDDFQLFDRGKGQTILKLTVEKSIGPDVIVPVAGGETKESPGIEALPAAILPERFVAYPFDEVACTP